MDMQKVSDRSRLGQIAMQLRLLKINPFLKLLISVPIDFEGLSVEFMGKSIMVIVCEDDENVFLVSPRAGIQLISKKDLWAGTN